MSTAWPTYDASLVYIADAKKIEKLYALISDIRKTRAEYKIDPAKKLKATIYGGVLTHLLQEKKQAIMRLANFEELHIEKKGAKLPKSLSVISAGMEVYMPLEQMFDVAKELERIEKDMAEHEKQLAGVEGRLKNPAFVANAKKEVVDQAKQDAEHHRDTLTKLKEHKVALEKMA